MTSQPQPHSPAPGHAPPPRGPGVFMAAVLLAMGPGCSQPESGPSKDPALRALGYLGAAQGVDGAFRASSLPEEVSTAFVLGLLSRSEPKGRDVDALLDRAAAFLLARQRDDGSFGEALASALCVMALTDFGRRLRGERPPDDPGVEIFDAAILCTEGTSLTLSRASHYLEALRAQIVEASDIEKRALEGQGEDGGWARDGRGGSDPIETAFRLRVIRLSRTDPGRLI